MKNKILLTANNFKHLFLLIFSFPLITFSQTVQITANPGQSTNIGIGPSNYHVSENIYTEVEIGAANFNSASTAINHIDLNVFALGTPTSVNNYRIYLKEVPLTTTTFTTGIYNTTGYTQVFNGTFNASATGWVGVDLTTTFVRTSGNNLQLLIERMDNVTHGAYSFNAARGNNTDPALITSRRYNSTVMPVPGTTDLNTGSAFRPQVQLRHINLNDAAITQVYTLGKLPIPFANPHVISANIINNGTNTITNLNVTLNITGANSFTNMQTIPSLASGAAATVTFAAFNPAVTGANNVDVSIPADDFLGDNNLSVAQTVTNNAYTYAYGTVASGAVGLNANTGDFVAKFTSSSPTSVNQVGVNFNAGGQPFKIGIWDKSGTGKPGLLLWESTTQTSSVGVFTLPISPAVAITDTFYIGVRQIGTTNISFSYQTENPIRGNTFFFTSPTGSTSWTDFAPGNPFKFMIEPRLTIANDVGITSINSPLGASSIDNCGILPQASIANFGSNNQSSPFNVTFSIKQSGSVVYTDTKPLTLNSGESQIVDFAPFTGSITGSDSSIVYTSLGTDGARNNDTLVNTFTSNNFSFGTATAPSGLYAFANSTTCAAPSTFQPTYNWITQTSNEINWGANGDDSVLANPIALPFNFNFFGINYNQFWICSNGWISFNNPTALSAATTRTPVTIPLAGGIDNYIAGLLADLDITTATYADAHTYYGGDASKFVITFYHAHLFGSTEYISFQIILNSDGNIIIQYNETETSSPKPTDLLNACSIGIENTAGSQGILYRLNGSKGSVFGSPLALQFRPTGIIPVSIINFSVQRINKINKINWSSSQEINSLNFIIERSVDGRSFSAIGQVPANTNSNRVIDYSFIDNAPNKGINYYRMQMVNTDFSKIFSPIKSVRNEGTADVSIYPNPVRDLLSIMINSDKPDLAIISIIDAFGKLVYTRSNNIAAGVNNIQFDANLISKGTYLIKIQLSSDKIIRKFFKE